MMNHFETIKTLLGELNISHEIFSHPKFSSTEEALSFGNGVSEKTAIKSLFFSYGTEYVLVLMRVCDKLDKEKLKALLGTTEKIQFASPEKMLELTGCEVGTVSPFCGLTNTLKTICDTNVELEDVMFCTPGVFTSTLKMPVKDFLGIVKPPMADVRVIS